MQLICYEIHRDMIKRGPRGYTEIIRDLQGAKEVWSDIVLMVGGYDQDPRPLASIPEVRECLRYLADQAPVMMGSLGEHHPHPDFCVGYMVCMACGSVTDQGSWSPDQAEELRSMLREGVTPWQMTQLVSRHLKVLKGR